MGWWFSSEVLAKLTENCAAVLSKEFGFSDSTPVYSGGLGTLNADMLLGAADLGLPLVGVGICYRDGYFRQEIRGRRQNSLPAKWNPESEGFELLPQRAAINIHGQGVIAAAWRKRITSEVSGKGVDFILLDTHVEGNSDSAKAISNSLYDNRHELEQGILLGLAGPEILQKLGYNITTYHMQEGHAAFVTLKLLQQFGNEDAVRAVCIFTNHTPVSAGMPTYSYDRVKAAIGYLLPSELERRLQETAIGGNGRLNTNRLAAYFSRAVTSVSEMHAGVMSSMPEFSGYDIKQVTNAVHWRFMAKRIRDYLDEALITEGVQGDWRTQPELLSHVNLDSRRLAELHRANKKDLVDFMNERALRSEHMGKFGISFNDGVFSVGFAKRSTPYKRADLPLSVRFQQLPGDGAVQLFYSGKAHPDDTGGLDMLSLVLEIGLGLDHNAKFGFLPDYSIEAAKLLVAGVDLWAITPIPNLEASGTSGMKTGLNGVPNISVLGGFWQEVVGRERLGYTFGGSNNEEEISSFAKGLEKAIIDCISGRVDSMRANLIVSFWQQFGSTRMMRQYAKLYGFEEKTGSLDSIVSSATA